MTALRMLTGDRPTGKLHLGHYVGSIANRVKLYRRYESYLIIADLHMLTTRNTRDDIAKATQNARDKAADILCVKAHVVPVGKDNAAHVEVTREIARRFNHLYGQVFPVPELVSAETTTLIGTDGRAKMSKSLGNAIALSDNPTEVHRKVMGMYTDPNRIRADVPGTVEGNPVFQYHDLFNPNRTEVDALKNRYREGRVGDVEVKEKLATALNRFLDPMRERRARYEADKGLVDELIVRGTERTRREVQQTVFEVRKAMGLTGVYTQLRRKAERTGRAASVATASSRPGQRFDDEGSRDGGQRLR